MALVACFISHPSPIAPPRIRPHNSSRRASVIAAAAAADPAVSASPAQAPTASHQFHFACPICLTTPFVIDGKPGGRRCVCFVLSRSTALGGGGGFALAARPPLPHPHNQQPNNQNQKNYSYPRLSCPRCARQFGADAAYADACITKAKLLYTFGTKYEGFYHNAVPDAASFYRSSSYHDDLVFAAIALYEATGDATYLADAEARANDGRMSWGTWNNYDWVRVVLFCVVLLFVCCCVLCFLLLCACPH